MQLGRWELLGASFSLFSCRPFLSVPGSLHVLHQQLPSPQPAQNGQLAGARIGVAQPAPGFLQPQEAPLLGRECRRAPGKGGQRGIRQPSPWTGQHWQEKQPLLFNNLIMI